MKLKLGIAGVVVAAGATAFLLWREEPEPPYVVLPPPPAKPSTEFPSTVMVPALETRIPEGKNAIWAAAFQLAWNRLKSDAVRHPIQIQGAEGLAAALNGSPLVDDDLVDGSFYAAAGFGKDGIAGRIRSEMSKRFPDVAPDFAEPGPKDVLAYAFLTARLRFSNNYLGKTRVFHPASGPARSVGMFGFGRDEPQDHRGIYSQPRVLHWDGRRPPREFIVDLDQGSSPHQVLIAVLPHPSSLKEGVDWVILQGSGSGSEIEPGQEMRIPNVAFGLNHHFSELEGRALRNASFVDYRIVVARQTVRFRLDQGGAETTQEAEIAVSPAAEPPPLSEPPPDFIVDRPFLLIMKKRGAARPYLVVWIDNPELLEPR